MPIVLTDNFESYAPHTGSSGLEPDGIHGHCDLFVIGPWTSYQSEIEAGVGRSGSQAIYSKQGAIQQYGLNGISTSLSGRAVVYATRHSIAQLLAWNYSAGFHHGLTIQPTATQAIDSTEFTARFGFYNDINGATHLGDDLVFYTNWTEPGGAHHTFTFRAANIYKDSTWQKFEFRWRMSSVTNDGLFVNPDGAVCIYVDDVRVVNQSGLYLTLRDDWATYGGPGAANYWDGTYYALGGYLDDVMVDNNGFLGCPAPVPPPPACVHACLLTDPAPIAGGGQGCRLTGSLAGPDIECA
jgi:hypothetical protein